MTTDRVTCGEHGEVSATYVCEHLIGAAGLSWHSHEPDDEHPWPDAWCGQCHTAFEREGEWNERSEVGVKISILCSACYERTKAKCNVHYI
jgi:hypothetical protein